MNKIVKKFIKLNKEEKEDEKMTMKNSRKMTNQDDEKK